MKNRCLNKSNSAYKNYGGRGISIDSSWLSFEKFLSDMGEPPENMTLERIDNEKGYSKENCIWASRKIQSVNRRNIKRYFYKGSHKTLTEIAEISGIKMATLWARLKKGFSIEEALKRPITNAKVFEFNGELTTIYELSKKSGLSAEIIYQRIKRGSSIEIAYKKPYRQHTKTYL